MKGKYVLDTGPMLLYFAGDLEARSFFIEIANGRAEGYTCEMNMAELYYKTCERFGRETAAIREASIRNSGISVIPMDQQLTHMAGGLKCRHKGILSLTDAYLLAAAKILKGTLVTTDSVLESLNLVNVKLIPI
ncbi:MAG: type II toxin-antitoxin system VapC family toxin [Candidatus Methanosuratincola petrocarbonis]